MNISAKDKSRRPAKMPMCLKFFVCYGLLIFLLDIISAIRWPVNISHATIPIVGWVGSIPYLGSMAFIITILVAAHFPSVGRSNVMWVKYPVSALMIIEIIRCILTFTIFNVPEGAHPNPYLPHGKWRIVVSGVIPMIWIWIWFSHTVTDYLRDVSNAQRF